MLYLKQFNNTFNDIKDYETNIPEVIYDDGISDFTRRRGPQAISRKVRHRIVPRNLPGDEFKEMGDFHKEECELYLPLS